MALPPLTRGALVYVQPRREMFMRRLGWMAMGLLGVMLSVLAIESRDSLWRFLLAAIFAAIFFGFAAIGALIRPLRLYENGIEATNRWLRRILWNYSDIRDVQLLRDHRGRATWARITRVDGTLLTIGAPRTKADLISFDLEKVAHLLDGAVRERGARPPVDWSPDVWAQVEPLIFRGRIMTLLERAAQAGGTRLIDTKFVQSAVAADRELAQLMSLGLITHAWEKGREREPPSSRT